MRRAPGILLIAVLLSGAMLLLRGSTARSAPSTNGANGANGVRLAAGGNHSLAVMTDGTLWAWGENNHGQLGDGTAANQTSPVPVAGLPGVSAVAVAAGSWSSLALLADGTVWAWGHNGFGQLGDGTTTSRGEPGQVLGLTDVVAISAGVYHALALKSDGTVWSWGYNASGQLGDGTATNRPDAAPVTGVAGAVAIAAGGSHSLVLLQDGTILAWGSNVWGQLGVGSFIDSATPLPVPGPTDIVSISAGVVHSLALRRDGTVWAWGWNTSGQIGDGTFLTRASPVRTLRLSSIARISAGYYHNFAIRTDGTIFAWGQNLRSQLGDGTAVVGRSTPVPLRALKDVVAIAGGGAHSVALTSRDVLWGWGFNSVGQIGDGTTITRRKPVRVGGPGLRRMTATPILQPDTGTYFAPLSVRLLCSTPRAVIHYTTNGQDPTKNDPAARSGDVVFLDRTVQLRARAWAPLRLPSNVASETYTFQVGPPTISPGGGLFTQAQEVSIATSTLGASIYYTLDGSEPTPSSAPYLTPIPVSTGTVVNARAFRDGFLPSQVASAAFTFNYGTLAPPALTPPGGTFIAFVTVEITAAPGALVRFTTDGSDPSPVSSLYAGPIEILSTTTLKAVAYQPDWTPSPAATGVYEIQVATPTLSPDGGLFFEPQEITLACVTPGASIHFTTSGVDPTEGDPAVFSGETVLLSEPATLKAKAFAPGSTPSEVASAVYAFGALPPVMRPRGGVFASPPSVALHSQTPGVEIRYTLDGTEPGPGSTLYAGPIQLGDSATLKARAYRAGFLESTIVSEAYLTGVGGVAAGGLHSLGLRPDGTVWSWGSNAQGQLGDDTLAGRASPAQVFGIEGVRMVAAGANHSLAILEGSSVWSWGANDSGQLGDGTTDPRNFPATAYDIGGIVAIAAGAHHSLALATDGAVWAWGDNSEGQLGDGTNNPSSVRVQVSGVGDAVAIAAGARHSLALLADGSVMAWGANDFGQLGNGTRDPSSVPMPVAGLGPIEAIAAGASHTLAVQRDGSVWAWGDNSSGQLGDGGVVGESATPLLVSGLEGAIAVSGGDLHSLVLKADGTVWSWGEGGEGQIGDGFFETRLAPVLVSGLDDIVQISAGSNHNLALGADGTVWAWGANADGQLGDGTLEARPSPVKVSEAGLSFRVATPVLGLLPGRYVSEQSVTVVCSTPDAVLHYTTNGEEPTELDPMVLSGDSVLVDRNMVLRVRAFHAGLPPSFIAEAAYEIQVAPPEFDPPGGTYVGEIQVSLQTATTGAEIRFTLDDSEPTPASDLYVAPIPVSHRLTIRAKAFRSDWVDSETSEATYGIVATAIAAGGRHSVALDGEGDVWAWGDNESGQLGDGTTTPRSIPGRVNGLAGVVGIASGTSHSLALLGDGTVRAWGGNASGQLGDGTNEMRSSPVLLLGLSDIVAVAAGGIHSLALDADGTVWAWGGNVSGQLGDGTNDARLLPVQVDGLTDVVAIAAGEFHSLALLADGTVWAWGKNDLGQLGNATQDDSALPVQTEGLGDTTAIAAGSRHSVAVIGDGTVWSWGDNGGGQLGDGSSTFSLFSTTPVQALSDDCGGECSATFTGALTVAAGGEHSLALRDDGSVWAWGENGSGQLGDGSAADRDTAAPVVGLGNVIRISAGGTHNLALDSDLAVWSWGGSLQGQVGDGTADDHQNPVAISEANFDWKVATPVLGLAPGEYHDELAVIMTTATSGALIHFTTDGSDVTEGSESVPSGGSVVVDRSLSVRARAFKPGQPKSNERTGTFTLVVSPPVLNPPPGSYDTPIEITVTAPTPGAMMHYTFGGVEPTESHPVILSGDSIPMDQAFLLTVRAFKPGWEPATTVGFYALQVLQPVFDPPPGTYDTEQDVAIHVRTSGAIVRYTTNGTYPTETSLILRPGDRVHVARNTPLIAAGFRADLPASVAAEGSYFLRTGAPVFSPPGGDYPAPLWINMASPTPGAVVRYTVDGTEPGPLSSLHQGPILVEGAMTLKARAFRSGWLASETTTEDYSVPAPEVATPAFSPPPGTYPTAQTVTISCITPGAVIRYTTNGLDPTELDPEIASGSTVTLDRQTVLKAKAWAVEESPIRGGAYIITGAVSAGFEFTLALKADGTVWAWGRNERGQLGYGGAEALRSTPVQVSLPPGIVAVSAGAQHALALGADGSVWAWGNNDSGQIGDGTFVERRTPVQIPGLSGIRAISAGTNHNLVLGGDGRVWAWGLDVAGELGNGAGGSSPVPIFVASLGAGNVVAIEAGIASSFAVGPGGAVFGWGSNYHGKLGLPLAIANAQVPSPIPLSAAMSAVSSGDFYAIALSAEGTGMETVWHLGADVSSFASDVDDAVAVSTSGQDALTLRKGGRVWLLRYGAPRLAVPIAGLDRIVAVGAGVSHFVALRDDGSVWAWGTNGNGELGDGTLISRESVAPVSGLRLVANGDAGEDPDLDLLLNADELRYGADPLNPDTNGDGISDGLAVALGLSPTNLDMDGDGVQNAVEIARGTDPFKRDTDGDGSPDGVDCFPLDPTRQQCLVDDPLDDTPPGITILVPRGLRLISSNP